MTLAVDGERRRLSVIICTYNTQRYLHHAIESALAIDWPDVEVVVVDDGSEDDSKSIIVSYLGPNVTAIFQENCGQAIACEVGLAISKGDLVLFLDADDLVKPAIMRAAMIEWRSGISKIQFQMETIDSEGRPIGSVFPRYPYACAAEDIRGWALACGDYPSPPGSGNIYAREFLEKIFPLERGVDHSGDSYCISAAPFLGDVITIREPLVSYRIHGENQEAMANLDEERFSTNLRRAERRYLYASRIAAANGLLTGNLNHLRSMWYMALRVCSYALTPNLHPIKNETRFAIVWDTFRAVFTPQGNTVSAQCALFLWILAIALLPMGLARDLVSWRFVPGSRPLWLRSIINSL